MSFQGFEVDANQASTGFGPMPEGVYQLMVEKVEDKPNKKGTGALLELTIIVVDGKFKGRKLWENFNYANSNPRAVQMAMASMHALGLKLDIKQFTPQAIVNKPFYARVYVKTETVDPVIGGEPERKNVIDFGTPVKPPTEAPASPTSGFFAVPVGVPTMSANAPTTGVQTQPVAKGFFGPAPVAQGQLPVTAVPVVIPG